MRISRNKLANASEQKLVHKHYEKDSANSPRNSFELDSEVPADVVTESTDDEVGNFRDDQGSNGYSI